MIEEFNQELKDMKICQPDEYELSFHILAPDRKNHQGIFNKEKRKMGYIHNKIYNEDDSWYVPYLVYEIGKKTGIDVPETELGIVLHKNINQSSFQNSFSESSIVYDGQPFYNSFIRLNDNISYVSPEVIRGEYFSNNPDAAEKRRSAIGCYTDKTSIEDYVNSYVWYLTNHGSRPRREYSKSEIDEMKQKLIDRALFSLRFDSYGNFDIILRNHENADLEPYYPSRSGMYFLNVREEKVAEFLNESDEEFKNTMDSNYDPQYISTPSALTNDSKQVMKYIFEKYPEQAEKAYKKLSSFTEKDFKELLESCTRMSENHKKVAIRTFEARGKEFDEVYQEHLKNQEQSR